MKILKTIYFARSNLRWKCFLIGYLNVIASIIDIVCHVLIVGIATNGFQCDVDTNIFQSIDWSWLEPLLVIVNVGTHGFYPFPLILPSYDSFYVNSITGPAPPRCYPGMIHVSITDVFKWVINVIWLQFVISFISAVHKKDPEPMSMFFKLSFVKVILQVMYFFTQPNFGRYIKTETYYFFSALDACIAIIFLTVINDYVIQLRNEKQQKYIDQPPPYIECLVSGSQTRVDEKVDAIPVVEMKKSEIPIEVESEKTS